MSKPTVISDIVYFPQKVERWKQSNTRNLSIDLDPKSASLRKSEVTATMEPSFKFRYQPKSREEGLSRSENMRVNHASQLGKNSQAWMSIKGFGSNQTHNSSNGI